MESEGVGHGAAEDKEEFGGKESSSPEKTLKALFNWGEGASHNGSRRQGVGREEEHRC